MKIKIKTWEVTIKGKKKMDKIKMNDMKKWMRNNKIKYSEYWCEFIKVKGSFFS